MQNTPLPPPPQKNLIVSELMSWLMKGRLTTPTICTECISAVSQNIFKSRQKNKQASWIEHWQVVQMITAALCCYVRHWRWVDYNPISCGIEHGENRDGGGGVFFSSVSALARNKNLYVKGIFDQKCWTRCFSDRTSRWCTALLIFLLHSQLVFSLFLKRRATIMHVRQLANTKVDH